MIALCQALALALALALPGKDDDVVELRDGTKVAGRVVYEDEARVVVRVGTRDREFERKEIARIDSRLASHREFLERWLALGPTDDEKLFDLLALAQRAGLDDDAQLLAWWILSRAPRNDEAHLALGHEKKGESWLVKLGSRRVAYADLAKLRAEWNDAWVLESRHYQVRTNLRLADAVDLTFGLECAHAAFYVLFGASLQLVDTTEPLVAHVYADKKAFPELTGTNGAYFEPDGRVLHVDASRGLDMGLVVHEACHQLLDATARAARGSRNSIPGWLDEGLAELLRSGFHGDIARWTFDQEGLMGHHFEAQAEAERPYDLARVLAFEAGDFLASTRQDLKYAQAYTLVHWALRARGGKYRNEFMAYLRKAVRGRGSSTDFKTAIGLDERALEKEWLEHVRSIVGVRK